MAPQGWLQRGRVVVAGATDGPLGTRSWGVWGTQLPSWFWGAQGTPQGSSTQAMAWFRLPSHHGGCPGDSFCSLGRPNSRTKGYPAIQQQQQFTQRAGARLAPPPPLPLSLRPPRAGLEVALP